MWLVLAFIAIALTLVLINPIFMPLLVLVGAVSFIAAVVSWLRDPTF